MGKYKIGLVNISMGDIAGDGGMGTSLSAVGDTVAGTAEMTTEDGQQTDFNIEESDSPVLSIETQPGAISLAWSSYAQNATTLQKFFGGTVVPAGSATGEIWVAPSTFPELEKSLQVEWKKGGKLKIPRAKVKGSMQLSFKKDSLSQINCTATVLTPTNTNVPRLWIENADN